MPENRALPDARRGVVTGLGMATPLGVGKAAFAERLFAGASGIGPVQAFDTQAASSRLGAEVRDFNPRDFIPLKICGGWTGRRF
jgi:3-oxoacyl-[acyl-carrier-protein] synthase II